MTAAFRFRNSPPNTKADTIRMAPMVSRRLRVPIQEMRKKPVAKVPMMEPSVEKA